MFTNFTKTLICLLAFTVCLANSVSAQQNSRSETSKQLQGDWHRKTGDERSSAEVSFSFDSSGNVSWELAVTSSNGKRDASGQQGKYSVTGNTLSMTYDDGGSDEFQFAVNNGVLVLSRDGSVFMEIDRAKNRKPASTPRITGNWYASATDANGGELAKTELLLRRGKFKMSIKFAVADRTDVIEGDYRLENGQIILDSDVGIERLPTRIGKDRLEIEIMGARFQFTRDGRNSNVELLGQ